MSQFFFPFPIFGRVNRAGVVKFTSVQQRLRLLVKVTAAFRSKALD